MATPKLNLPTITGNETADVPRDFNALANAIDNKAGVADGLATLGPDGKVPSGQVNVDLQPIEQALATHTAEDATLTAKGHVQLNSSVTSTSETLAATPKAVKTAMDRADAAFTSASNGKQTIGGAITGADSNVTIPANPTFQQLAEAIGQISTGVKMASGTGNSSPLTVTGLDFKPSKVIIYAMNGSYTPYAPIVIFDRALNPTQSMSIANYGNTTYTNISATNYVNQGTFRLGGNSSSSFWIAIE